MSDAIQHLQPWDLPLPDVCGYQLTADWCQSEAELEQLSTQLLYLLGPRERALWQALPQRFHRRREWLGGRLAAKWAVMQQLEMQPARPLMQGSRLEGRSPTSFEILPDTLGRPVVHSRYQGLDPPLATVSISHLRGGRILAAAAPAGHQIGIDITTVGRVRVEDIISLAFTEQDLAALPSPLTDSGYLALWAAKEAAAKAAGTGLQGRPTAWQATAYRRSTHEPFCCIDIRHLDSPYQGPPFSVLVWHEMGHDVVNEAGNDLGDDIVALCHVAQP